jgi:hypothetical protein
MATVATLQPNNKHTAAMGMPSSFLAFGTANGKELAKVRLRLTKKSTGKDLPQSQIRLLRFGPCPKPMKYHYTWVALFVNVTGIKLDTCTLTVQGVDRKGHDIPSCEHKNTFDVRAVDEGGPPIISYPPPGYKIEGGERSFFMPFGSSEIAMTGCDIGGTVAQFLGWDSDLSFWYAVFSDLDMKPGTGVWDLTASNGDGDTVQKVEIA